MCSSTSWLSTSQTPSEAPTRTGGCCHRSHCCAVTWCFTHLGGEDAGLRFRYKNRSLISFYRPIGQAKPSPFWCVCDDVPILTELWSFLMGKLHVHEESSAEWKLYWSPRWTARWIGDGTRRFGIESRSAAVHHPAMSTLPLQQFIWTFVKHFSTSAWNTHDRNSS